MMSKKNRNFIPWIALLLFLFLFPVSTPLQANNGTPAETTLSLLEHEESNVRLATIQNLREREATWAVRPLIERLQDDNEEVRQTAYQTLVEFTGRENLPPEYNQWLNWYQTEGAARFPLADYREDGPAMGVYMMIMGVLILILIIFITIGGYRLKQLKEMIRRAESSVSQAEELSRSIDEITEEIEQNKRELQEYMANLKEEKERELDRHAELLGENNTQKAREEIRNLRESAEREVEQTMEENQEKMTRQIKRELRDLAEEYKQELEEKHEDFNREAEAQRKFLEASFYDISGDREEALREYDRVLEMKPDHKLALQRKGRVLREKERYESAVEVFEDVLELESESPGLFFDLAATYALMERKDLMLDYLEKAISIQEEYKDEALNDEAFRKYWDDRDFRDLTET